MGKEFFRLPVVSAGAEFLAMGFLMRRNILAYKAPPGNEGYDLICIHPNPRHRPGPGELPQVRVQVKSRYATDCDRGFPVKEESLDAFDFLIIAFLNIGRFGGRNDGSDSEREPEFYNLPTRTSLRSSPGTGVFLAGCQTHTRRHYNFAFASGRQTSPVSPA